jgi:peptide/nickel transport system substrate-binding protein
MARRIRWQIIIAALSTLLVAGLLGRLALRGASLASPLAGGSYREALVGAPQNAIPLLNDPLADPVGRDLGALLFNGLVRIGADGRVEPDLAETIEVDQSGTAYTFHLRRGVRWHDGAPFSADDVIFTLRSLQILDSPGEPAVARAWQAVLVDRIDDFTVRCTLPEPLAAFLSNARLPILPAHLLAGVTPSQWASVYGQKLVGTGPFALTALREDGAQLQANPSYFGGRPYLDSVELRFMATPEAALGALARGDVSAYGERASIGQAGVAQGLAAANLPGSIVRNAMPLDEYAVLSFNLHSPPLDNQALRQALARGLNKEAMIEGPLSGLAQPVDSPILPGSLAYSPDARWYPPDSAAAARLLGELGYDPGVDGVRQRDGQRLALSLIVDSEPRRLAAANEIARQWGDLGVQVTVEQVESTELQRRLASHTFTLAVHSWARLGPDPDPYSLWHSSQAAAGLNYAGLRDDEIDRLLMAARGESDLANRNADYAAFQQRWIDLAPSIALYQPLYLFATDQHLNGVGPADAQSSISQLLFGSDDRYRSVSRWFINSYREIEGQLPRAP